MVLPLEDKLNVNQLEWEDYDLQKAGVPLLNRRLLKFKYALMLHQKKACLEDWLSRYLVVADSLSDGIEPVLLWLRTPLMLSVLNGHTDCVYSLLNKGASVDAKDKWGRTALHRGVSRIATWPAEGTTLSSYSPELN